MRGCLPANGNPIAILEAAERLEPLGILGLCSASSEKRGTIFAGIAQARDLMCRIKIPAPLGDH